MFDREELYRSATNRDAPSFAEWQGQANSVPTNRLDGAIKYFNDFFPVSLRLFKAVLEKQKRKGEWNTYVEIEDHYSALISIIGLTPAPLIHTICALSPSEVYPVVTKEVLKHYMNKCDGKDLTQYFTKWINSKSTVIQDVGRVVSSEDSLDTFRKVKEVVEEIRKKNDFVKIAIDVTGGKKSSVVSAFFMAALDRDIDIFYVDFEKYESNISKPCCGTEFLNKLDNPYDVYNVQLLSQAKELFKHHNYQAAYSIFSDIEQKLSPDGLDEGAMLGLDMERLIVRKMKAVSKCYEHWDMFEYNEAFSEQYHGLLDLNLVRCLKHPNTSCKIYEVDNQLEYVKKISLDRYANAERRFQQGRYEDALTRYMQSLEISCKSYAINTIVIECFSARFKNLSDQQIQTLGNSSWRQWEIDYAPISAILDWLLCIERMKWKNSKGSYFLDELMITDFKDRFCEVFLLNKELSKNKFKEQVKVYTDLIEDRNKFIHVSSLSINRVQVEVFREFIYKMLICLYGIVDLTPYMFSTEFDENGALLPLLMDKEK